VGFAQQEQAAKLFEAVYARHLDHPGAPHYLIHAYDDPEHAQQGLKAARAYAQAAAAVPHALHMPSHIFTRLGYSDESAATNLKGWEVSQADVKRAGESGAYRDYHNLNYLEYAYIQLGRFRDAQHTVDIAAAQYQALPNDLSQPPYPVIPATELSGDLLLNLKRPAEAVPHFRKALQRTPNRPKSIFGLARAAQALGDNTTAGERYQEFLSIWKDADPDRPEVATAREFLVKQLIAKK
jgi:tetratricopeptide (TPR) repeat protein